MKSQLACYVVTLAFLVVGIGRYSRAQELGKFKDNDEWVQFVHHSWINIIQMFHMS